MNSCRVWVKELDLSKFKRVLAWVKGTHEQERNAIMWKGHPVMIELKTWLIDTDQCSKTSLQNSLFFSRLPLLGDFYILYRPFPIIWALHLLIIQTPTWASIPSDTPLNSLWVVVAKVTLFRGLLLINVARRVVVMHLMWWWQPLLRYFEFPSFLRIWKMDYRGLDVPLPRIL